MFRKKGLFWYTPSKRVFDWSVALNGAIFGYGDSYLSKKHKNHYKKKFLSSFISSNSRLSSFLKSQLSLWIKHYPQLIDYSFFLATDLELMHLFNNYSLVSSSFEKTLDPLLYHLSLKGHTKKVTPKIITDISWLYNHQILNESTSSSILYTHSSFPILPFSRNTENISTLKTENQFLAIIVGGQHPFQLNGQKLLILKNQGAEEFYPKIKTSIDFWHLSIYIEGIKHYYDLLKRKQFIERKKTLEKTLLCLKEWSKSHKCKLEVTVQSETPFRVKVKLYKKNDKLLTEVVDMVWKNRIFYRDTTIITEEQENYINFYIHLPINFVPHHLENKWKQLTELFSLL